MPDNPLDDTGELSTENLRDVYDDEQPTVDELLDALEQEDYSADQLYALQNAEREDRDRKTAKEALNSAIEDAAGAGDDDYEVEAETEDDLEASDSDDSENEDTAVDEDVEMATDTQSDLEAESEADQEDNQEMDLLNAEENTSNESPAMQRAVKGAGATNAGDDPLNLPDPYGDDAPDTVRIVVDDLAVGFAGEVYEEGEHDVDYSLRVKQSLEGATNEVRLADSDPLYPEGDDDE